MGINNKQSGFTIIETMFFLAISGLMMVGLAAAMSNMINNQRYNDSVNRLKSALQDEYNSVVNVRNDRDSGWRCEQISGNPYLKISQVEEGGSNRGASNCVLIGRFIHFIGSSGNSGQGTSFISYPIYGLKKDSYTEVVDESQILKSVFIRDSVATLDTVNSTGMDRKFDVSWQNTWKVNDVPTNTYGPAVAILRNPQNNQIITFSEVNIPTGTSFHGHLWRMINGNLYKKDLKICVDDGSGVSRSAVTIKAGSSSSAGVITESCN